jgi:hypothetical protein
MDYFDHVMAERDIKITGNMYRQQVRAHGSTSAPILNRHAASPHGIDHGLD